ncbi:hypothetical protein QCM77_41090 [Bradyrhizobium sp. SSUT18]|uniref:hypothetical protein n=1 Tax=unclassified Bradyrhizobium TaxID=2631580 RepID=UPI00244918C9|nr:MULTISPECIES: hypothetical protein [unclassified Bradyrhizobium]MDH2354576.1 hypothetical protein [Bradyrhizobium sp. SSUT112]MDH2406227.1 hypothetical protein [Bradyrhizobium sp. SSUT18]
MTDDAKQRLVGILARDKELNDKKIQEKTAQQTRVAEAHAKWSELVDKELLPAVKSLAQTFTNAGWFCETQRTSTGFRVSVYRGDMRTYGGRERPYVLFEAQNGYDSVQVTEGTPSSVGPVHGTRMTASGASTDEVTKLITDLAEKLALK